MDTIALPSRTVYIKFDVITHLFANAMCAQPDAEGMRSDYTVTHGKISDKLSRAVELGDLRVKDPLTLAPHHYPVGAALCEAVIHVNDLRQYAARHGLPEVVPVIEPAELAH